MQKTFAPIASLSLQAAVMGLCVVGGDALAQTLAIPRILINLTSPEGGQLLIKSEARTDYLPLSVQFVTQKNQAYCGVASSIMVLNALGIPAPVASEFAPYRVFTQDNFFNERTQKVLTSGVVSRQGMTLDQLSQLLETYPVTAKAYHAGNVDLAAFRTLVVKNLQEPGNFVLINYLRRAIAQETGGHISPIAAYDAQTDRFLILDVSRYKYPPIWVQAADLWRAMNTTDSVSNKTRGFVLIGVK